MKVSPIGFDVTELTGSKRLYIFELAITKRSWAPDGVNPVLYRVPLMIFGHAEWSKDGQWGTTHFGASILGINSGYWWIGERGRDGLYSILLSVEKPPNLLTGLWEDYPEGCGLFEKIQKYPLTLGSSGPGNMHLPQNDADYRWLTWKVTDRSF